ncbi:hypothetical protein QAD02_006718 [Eretmocerus hayati]|uniref:Uncharacterized protein n=1 Tax=Eretmocerus hayati TaxID=131215 RepID=A0ACC2N2G0_9HYME|nr:hypothetical protein QAD02_006718 [Eretmocerus hayati]
MEQGTNNAWKTIHSSYLDVRLIGPRRLMIGGYVYWKTNKNGSRAHWMCPRYPPKFGKQRCRARALTSNIDENDGRIDVIQGPIESRHNHPPYLSIGGARSNSEDQLPTDGGGKSKLPFCDIPLRMRRRKRGQTTYKISSYDRAFRFLKEPVNYQEILSKFVDNPSFDKESIFRIIDSIWDLASLGISRIKLCRIILMHEYKIKADLHILLNGTSESSVYSPSHANLEYDTQSNPVPYYDTFYSVADPIDDTEYDETIYPDISFSEQSTSQTAPVPDLKKIVTLCKSAAPLLNALKAQASISETLSALNLANTKTNHEDHNYYRTKINGNLSSNEGIIELLTSTLQVTLDAVQQLTDAMATKKNRGEGEKKIREENGKEGKRKKLKTYARVKIKPSTPDDIPRRNARLHNEPQQIQDAIATVLVKEECIDLPDEDVNISCSSINHSSIEPSSRPNYSAESFLSNAPKKTSSKNSIPKKDSSISHGISNNEFAAKIQRHLAPHLTQYIMSLSSSPQIKLES